MTSRYTGQRDAAGTAIKGDPASGDLTGSYAGAAKQTFLTPDQVYALNEKHGWFQFGDAQSDVSRAFAQDAIAMHERIRAAAQDMLAALESIESMYDDSVSVGDLAMRLYEARCIARLVIAKVTGKAA